MENQKESLVVFIGKKFGCLQALDDGTEYLQAIDDKISDIKNGSDSATKNKAIEQLIKRKSVKHYKCRCEKCNKIRYYSEETLQKNPMYCYRPIFCTSKYSYSTKAQNANFRKMEKYKGDESVLLVDDRDAIHPADEYCDAWNKKKGNELKKKEAKENAIIAALPRRYAKNYNIEYAGKIYESLEILECVNDALESPPIPYYTQKHEKGYRDITVYKQYRCKCYLCGKEQLVTCDKFGIYPPTEYGYNAYNGYWSDVSCDCHKISSFQWIVNSILMKHNIKYKVEVEFEGLYGIDDKTPLRFDFGIYKNENLIALIECQGEQHFMPVEEFGGAKQFAIQQKNDERKRLYAKDNNIKIIELSYKKKKYDIIEKTLKAQGII